MFVRLAFRGRGLARRLIEVVEDEARRLGYRGSCSRPGGPARGGGAVPLQRLRRRSPGSATTRRSRATSASPRIWLALASGDSKSPGERDRDQQHQHVDDEGTREVGARARPASCARFRCPPVASGEVRIRVLRTGICGTDLHIQTWDAWAAATIPTPRVIGHEIAGVVDEVGPGVDTVEVGDLVSVEGHVVCGRCRNCLAGRRQLCPNTVGVGVNRDGGFAEYVVVPATNVWRHPGRPRPRRGRDLRPVRQRRAHGIGVRDVWARTCW